MNKLISQLSTILLPTDEETTFGNRVYPYAGLHGSLESRELRL